MNITSQQFNDAFGKLPFPIRAYLMGDELGAVIQSVSEKYNLHVDTMGAVEREITNMLLGYENPEQFMGELRSIGVAQESVGPMIQEFNTRIFIPLREKIQKEGTEDPHASDEAFALEVANDYAAATAAQPAPIPQYVPVAMPVFTPAPSYAQPPIAPPPSISQFNQPQMPTPVQYAPQQMPQTPVYQAPVRPLPPPPDNLPGTGIVMPIMSAHTAQPEVRTMAKDMSAAQSGTYEVPPTNYAPTPMPSFVPAAATITSSAQQSTANQTPVFSMPTITSAMPPKAPRANNAQDLHQVLKQYGIDPYREPVE